MKITGTYVDAKGAPVEGKIHFTPNQFVLNEDGIQVRKTITAVLVDGSFAVTLQNPQEQPWTIRVYEEVPKGRWFDIEAMSGNYDLKQLSPVVEYPEPIVRGPKGDTGDKGDKGDTGERGLQGLKGDKGDKGDQGAQGIQGLKGDKGDKGDRGASGVEVMTQAAYDASTPVAGVLYVISG